MNQVQEQQQPCFHSPTFSSRSLWIPPEEASPCAARILEAIEHLRKRDNVCQMVRKDRIAQHISETRYESSSLSTVFQKKFDEAFEVLRKLGYISQCSNGIITATGRGKELLKQIREMKPELLRQVA